MIEITKNIVIVATTIAVLLFMICALFYMIDTVVFGEMLSRRIQEKIKERWGQE